MDQFSNTSSLDVNEFLKTGLNLKDHLAGYLGISENDLTKRLPKGVGEMAALHPGIFKAEEATGFYEAKVGTAHLVELAAWHLGSADYIADTLRLQSMFARGELLDFGGGIGTHALSAAALSKVKHVSFVDLNPHNREFVRYRAEKLGLENKISVYRDLESTKSKLFDTLVCLDVLEHLPDPSSQLRDFLKCMAPDSIVMMNWYFFKGFKGEYPFHFDDKDLVDDFFRTLQSQFLEVFHPYLITTRVYKPLFALSN